MSIIKKSFVNQLTKDGEYHYPYIKSERVEVKYSKTYGTCYYNEIVLKKIKGGGPNGGNYYDEVTGDEYRIST